MWRNDAFHFWRHHWLTKTITMKTTQPIKQTTYTWRITFLVYLPTATPDWMCCSPIHQNTKSDTGLIRKLRLKHPHTTHIGFASEPSAMSMSRSYGLLHGLTVNDYTVACIRIIVQQKNHTIWHTHTLDSFVNQGWNIRTRRTLHIRLSLWSMRLQSCSSPSPDKD